MSKRRFEREIDVLNETFLENLSSDERVQLLLTSFEEGKDEWSGTLAETCPRHPYIQPDQQVVVRMEILYLFAAQAVYELHTMYLEQQLCWQQQLHCWSHASPSEEVLEQAEVRAETLRELVGSLYIIYYSYRRFATETVGVDADTWLQLHPNGPAVFEAVGDLLKNRRKVRHADDHVAELLEETERTGETGDTEALNWLMEQRYEGLVDTWERVIAQAP